MITDPDDPGYRYPEPGERLWHEPSQQWVEVVPEATQHYRSLGEVPVRLVVGGSLAAMKLRSLREQETPRPAVSPLLGLPYTVGQSGCGYVVDLP